MVLALSQHSLCFKKIKDQYYVLHAGRPNRPSSFFALPKKSLLYIFRLQTPMPLRLQSRLKRHQIYVRPVRRFQNLRCSLLSALKPVNRASGTSLTVPAFRIVAAPQLLPDHTQTSVGGRDRLLRKILMVSLDELLAEVREFLNPNVSLPGQDHCLRRHVLGSLCLKAKD